MKKILSFVICALALTALCSAQTTNSKNISLEAAKKSVDEAVKYALG